MNLSNSSGVLDPQFEIMQIEVVRGDRANSDAEGDAAKRKRGYGCRPSYYDMLVTLAVLLISMINVMLTCISLLP